MLQESRSEDDRQIVSEVKGWMEKGRKKTNRGEKWRRDMGDAEMFINQRP